MKIRRFTRAEKEKLSKAFIIAIAIRDMNDYLDVLAVLRPSFVVVAHGRMAQVENRLNRICTARTRRAYYLRTAERQNAKSRAYYHANSERIKQQKREYRKGRKYGRREAEGN